jgi:hypothetical protein
MKERLSQEKVARATSNQIVEIPLFRRGFRNYYANYRETVNFNSFPDASIVNLAYCLWFRLAC